MTRRGIALYDWKLVGALSTILVSLYLAIKTSVNNYGHLLIVYIALLQMFFVEMKIQNTLRAKRPLITNATLFNHKITNFPTFMAFLRAIGENVNGVYVAYIATDALVFPHNYNKNNTNISNIDSVLIVIGSILLFLSHLDLCCPLYLVFEYLSSIKDERKKKDKFVWNPQLLSTREMFGNQSVVIGCLGIISFIVYLTLTNDNQQFCKWFFIVYVFFSFIWNIIGQYCNCRYISIDEKGNRASVVMQFFVHILYNLVCECGVFMTFNCVIAVRICQTLT